MGVVKGDTCSLDYLAFGGFLRIGGTILGVTLHNREHSLSRSRLGPAI